MLDLSNITLFIADTIDPYRALHAIIASSRECYFEDIVLITHRKHHIERIPTKDVLYNMGKENDAQAEEILRRVKIYYADIGTIEEYSRFMVEKLNNYVSKPYCLVIQYDGYILNPEKWDKRFLDYDYIGAVWYHDNMCGHVGNGGFSLRSKRIIEYAQRHSKKNTLTYHPEDVLYCYLGSAKFKIAPPEIAAKFSTEYEYRGQFGFHYNKNLPGMFKMYRNAFLRDSGKTAVQSGELGDIIYAIPTLKKLNVKKIVLNINPPKYKMGRQQADCMKPLLEHCGFDVEITRGYNPIKVDYVMDEYRLELAPYNTPLCYAYSTLFNVQIDVEKQFIPPIYGDKAYNVVINSTERYLNPDFDWDKLLSAVKGDILFLGTDDEYYIFTNRHRKLKVDYKYTRDLVEVVEILSNCNLFIGNQSCIFAIAQGLQIPRIQETCPYVPNCKPAGEFGYSVISRKNLETAKKIIQQIGV